MENYCRGKEANSVVAFRTVFAYLLFWFREVILEAIQLNTSCFCKMIAGIHACFFFVSISVFWEISFGRILGMHGYMLLSSFNLV